MTPTPKGCVRTPRGIRIALCSFACAVLSVTFNCNAAEDQKIEPITVNGDTVEYSTDNKEVTATGNVEVIYKGAKLTCEKLTVNTQSKLGTAEGNARLEDKKGVIKGAKIVYNFDTKIGTIADAQFESNPYFGKAKEIQKVSDAEFIALQGYATTCDLDRPHYRLGGQQIKIFPGDKMQIKDAKVYIAQTPILSLPEFNRSLKDEQQHFLFMPGSRKVWGPYLLSLYRYNLAEGLDGRLYLDYRQKLGVAEGMGLNYHSNDFGRGDYKFYYTNEMPKDLPTDAPQEFERYFLRWRHRQDLDPMTSIVAEFDRIVDEKRKYDTSTSFLKDYFFREFEKDSQPLTYATLHHNFQYSSIDFLVQKRLNHWFDQLDELPEVKYALPTVQMGTTPLYFDNSSTFAHYNQKGPAGTVPDADVNETRLDTTNRLSLPTKLLFLELTPFVADRETAYDTGANGQALPVRTIFYSGVNMSTKFYRVFDVKSHFLGLDIEGLRHIITPTVAYSFNNTPTIPSYNLRQIDTIDALSSSNAAALGLSNKLQTKRNGQSVDMLDFLVTTNYIFNPKTGDKHGSNFSDVLYRATFLPYSWVRLDLDATYAHSNRSDNDYNHFSIFNYDFNFDLGKERSLGIGQRFQRSGSNEVTSGFSWRFSPKWKLSTYSRFEFTNDPVIDKGWQEQEISVSRDLHCWTMDVTYDYRKNNGMGLYFVFRVKAFPEMQFGFHQSYTAPRSGAQ